jgi:RNA polymerase sigma factor (sigma-70 family)
MLVGFAIKYRTPTFNGQSLFRERVMRRTKDEETQNENELRNTKAVGGASKGDAREFPAARSELFRQELEIPVEQLLTHEEELSGSRKIVNCLARLTKLLPSHPLGYRRFIARMEEITSGLGTFYSWYAKKENMSDDLAVATKALRRAESQAQKNPAAARRAFEKGVKVLLTYPLDPETLYRWSKEITDGSWPLGPLGNLESAQKVDRLLKRAMADLDWERDRLVMPNLRLVLREVFRFSARGMRESDLFQEGFLGLNKAVFRFDPQRKLRFSTYATHWIRQSIRKALIDKSSLIRLPQALHEKRYREQKKLSAEEMERIRRVRGRPVLFSAMATDDDDSSFDVRDQRSTGLSEMLRTDEIPQVVGEALSRLNETEQEVVSRRFGLAGARCQTLEEIGSHMHLSRERIRQIEKSALEQMQEFRDLQETYEELALVESPAVA